MIKINLRVLLSSSALLLACCLPNTNAYAVASSVHGNASSYEDQLSDAEGPHVAKIEHVDSLHNITHSSDSMFSIQKSGTYFIIATGQAGVNIVSPPGYLDLWLARNGNPIPNSGSRVYIAKAASTSVVTSQTVLDLYRGDIISVEYSSTNPSIGLRSLPPLTPNEPAIPSLNLSIMLIKP